jgi:hypothetical protein
MMQPPARGAAERAHGRGRLEHIDENQRRARGMRGLERRIVGEPQIVAKPDDGGRCCGGSCGHGLHDTREGTWQIKPIALRHD